MKVRKQDLDLNLKTFSIMKLPPLDVMPFKDGVVGPRPLIRSGPIVQPIEDSACIKAYSTDLEKQVPTAI